MLTKCYVYLREELKGRICYINLHKTYKVKNTYTRVHNTLGLLSKFSNEHLYTGPSLPYPTVCQKIPTSSSHFGLMNPWKFYLKIWKWLSAPYLVQVAAKHVPFSRLSFRRNGRFCTCAGVQSPRNLKSLKTSINESTDGTVIKTSMLK